MRTRDLKKETESLTYFNRLAKYYDKAFVLEEAKQKLFVGILTQELHNEPYMDIDLDEVDLINYQGQGSLENMLNFIEQYRERPQIARTSEKDLNLFQRKGWTPIKNKDGTTSILRKVRRYILANEIFEISSKIRSMKGSDLKFIEDLFRKEYPLRYRTVQYLFEQDKESNFVFTEGNDLVGVTFNERRFKENYLYCRQIFVKESKRKQGIGTKLNQFRLSFARNNGLYVIFANIRNNAEMFHLKQGVEILTESEFYLIKN